MVTNMERMLITRMVTAGKLTATIGLFRTVEIRATTPGMQQLLARIKARQQVDDWHHAPCCPANHWHRARLVFHGYNCGAEHHQVK